MPRISSGFPKILIVTPLALFFLLPSAALADTVHCGCQPSTTAPASMMTVSGGQKLCYDIDSSKLTNPADCSTLPANSGIGTILTCDKTPLTPTQAQPVSKGICAQGPQPAMSATTDAVSKSNQNTVPQMPIPVLNTAIPGFTAPKDYGSLFGSYIISIYRYGLSISVVVATVMFIWGAFIYLLGSGGMGSIQKGKEIMTDAVIGMLLLFGANLILRTVNPNTVIFTSLNPSPIQYTAVPLGQVAAIIGATPPSPAQMLQIAKDTAAKSGIPQLPCIVYASMINESGGKFVIGHDEDFQSTLYVVGSRQAFLRSGIKFSGATFTPDPCTDVSCQKDNIVNDDNNIDLTKPPDYGIDWRFSHGIGPAQSTIFPKDQPCPGRESEGRGFRMAGKCYTVPDLFKPENIAQIATDHFKSCFNQAHGDIAGTYVCYAGNISPDNPIIQKRVSDYNACASK